MTDLIARLRLMSAFLRGEIEFKGAWFGDNADGERGKFWWRKYLPLTEAADELSALRERVEALEGAARAVCDGQATPESVKNLRAILAQQGGEVG